MQLKDKKLFIFDMDGVLYRHTTPIPAAIDVVKQLKNKGKKVTFLTNNSTKTQEQFVQKLKKMGLTVKPKSIYTSATITSEMLSKNYDGNTVYVIGEDGLKQALKEEGFILLNEMRPNLEEHEILPEDVASDLVVMGMDTEVTFAKFRTAMMLILNGAEFYATNGDFNFPVPGTLWPGTGAQIAFLEKALGHAPKKIFGKPAPDGVLKILKEYKCKKDEAVLIGDRFNTDILAGNNAKVETVCVETGINTEKDLKNTPREEHPDHIYATLEDWYKDVSQD